MDPKVRAHLVEELDLIISCAASINFREHLHSALQTNYFGAVRMLDLALLCKKNPILSHVSTAFVGSN
jgi:thioester reductase-like protein